MQITKPLTAAIGVSVAAMVVAACGGSSGGGGNSASSSAAAAAPSISGLADVKSAQGQTKGGTLNVVSAEGWALFVEAERGAAAPYPQSTFPEPLSRLVDEERRAAYESIGSHFESRYRLTLLWLPPGESTAKATRVMLETPQAVRKVEWREHLATFVAETERFRGLLEGVMSEIAWLRSSEKLSSTCRG